MKQLGQILVEQGVMTESALLSALEEQHARGESLGSVLVELGLVTESQLVAALADQVGMEFIDLSAYSVDAKAVALVPPALCRRHGVLPVARRSSSLVLAMSDPGNVVAVDDVSTATGMRIIPIIATREDLARGIERYCRADGEIQDLSSSFRAGQTAKATDADLAGLGQRADADAPIVRYVNLLVTQAIQDRASDIHIEPAEHEVRVRYRIDGVLQGMQPAPKHIQPEVVSRIKIMSDLDIAERRKPQDGRMSVAHHGRTIDLRVATLPTVWGEKVVMRILDNSSARLALGELDFSGQNLAAYRRSFTRPHGMILVTGPTGSGKSTTLYATLNAVARDEINVITVEDPVEYRLDGINQVQVNPKAGLTFASALRSILRSDPDVVLIGEIRDRETAQIAIEAALTGHLVLSTLHTNDAPSAVTRLVEMGIAPFLIGAALNCVVAQRLARRLCGRCKEPYLATPEEQASADFPWEAGADAPKLWRAVGCPECAGTGYRGRLAVHEVMTVTEEIERHAVHGSASAEIERTARSQGMSTLREDGWAKVLLGETTIEEVLRVAS